MTDAKTAMKGLRWLPINDRVIVRAQEAPTNYGSIALPDTSKESNRAARGMVIAVGPGRMLDNGQREEMFVPDGRGGVRELAPGDIVQFGSCAGQYMDDSLSEERLVKDSRIVILRWMDIHCRVVIDETTES